MCAVMYPNWLAERKARTFCEEVAIGLNINDAIKKMNQMEQPYHYWWEDRSGYSFIFRGLFVEYAYCNVELDKDGNVLKKEAKMVYN